MADGPDFIPYQAETPDFIPYQAEAEKPPASPSGGMASPATGMSAQRPFNPEGQGPFSRYLQESENLTEQGKQEHPVQALVGKVSSGVKGIGGILGTMGTLLMGPEGILAGAPEKPAEPTAAGPAPSVPKTPESAPAPAAGPVPESSAPVAGPKAIKPPKTEKLITQAMNEQFGVKPPEPGKPIFFRDSMGIKWAEGPGGVKVSIPNSVPEEQAAGYANQKLTEQAAMRSKLKPLGAEVSEATQQPAAGPRIQTPSRNETLLENMKNRVPGSNPLEKNVPLGEQPASPERTPAQVKDESLHPEDRQLVHARGSKLFEALPKDTNGEPVRAIRDAIMDLDNEQLRELLRKSGEDIGGHIVTSASKTMDPLDYTPQEAFDILLEKGYTPEKMLKEAPARRTPAKPRIPFGPKR